LRFDTANMKLNIFTPKHKLFEIWGWYRDWRCAAHGTLVYGWTCC
jgi:hypothetical protein